MPETQWVPTIPSGSNVTRDALNKLINQGRNWPSKPAEPVNANGNDLINVGEIHATKITVYQPIAGAGSPSNIMGKPIAADTPANGDVMVFNGTAWEAKPAPSAGTSYTDPFMYAAAVPTGAPPAGKVGICWHTAPIPGGNAGWIYTASGWKAFGSIEE